MRHFLPITVPIIFLVPSPQYQIAKVTVTVKDVKVPNPERNPDVYVKVKIGPISFQTPRRPVAGPWGDSFEFRINHHARLFYTIQV